MPCRKLLIILTTLGLAGATLGQQPTPVQYDLAREHTLRESIQLPGTATSPAVSTVASDVAGRVVELSAREGAVVAKGDPLARLRRRPLDLLLQAAQADLKEALARREQAELSLTRARDLASQQVLSQQELDDAIAEFTAQQGRVERAQANIASIEEQLERSVIRAPFKGVITAEHVETGEWVTVGGPVVEVARLDPIEITIHVPESYFGGLEVGTLATIRFESGRQAEINAPVKAIIPKADSQARTFPVKIRVPNPGHRIGIGMLAQVLLPVGDPYRATIVPKDAVVRTGGPARVFLIEEGGDSKTTVASREVRTGLGVDGWVEILEGIETGQKVVTRGNERLRPDQEVVAEAIETLAP